MKRKTNTSAFYSQTKEALEQFVTDCKNQGDTNSLLSKQQLSAIEEIEDLTDKTSPPLQHLEHVLHGWVAYLIMPLFAFANAGVVLSFGADANFSLTTNIALSMIFGNAIGIFSFSFLAIKLKISELPQNVTYSMLAGISILGGLGFTMSLFINSLAFTEQGLIDSAKIGVLIGSIVAGIFGFVALKLALKAAEKKELL